MPFLVDRGCPEWQQRNRERRRTANLFLLGFLVLFLVSLAAVDYFFPSQAAVAREEVVDQ